ncbi:class I SAM-dependent methyltransferase [Candidatus Bathyarchaeota archaeon]|nr:class I SAM-dependent methyltransferase [Candidatus Bathyarchaeota archaeon]MBT4423683.1 class I SAM-dependent methyltransferase [Candidatus Bathyarchaeota archaeon]MBT7345904.1 class I SAM-dependent methyltransferase [Candidatus Bathyarchaeota archaeon]
MNDYYETNKKRWNELVAIHSASEEYDIEGFLAGQNTVKPVEIEALGDITEKSLLHLQCHFGMDTISWSRLGAKATGVDFSDTAIELAIELARKAGTDTEFVCSNVYDLKNNLVGEYDIVYTAIGVLCWLQDIDEWGRIIAHFLKSGGTFLIYESHPFMWVFDDEVEGMKIKYRYWHKDEPIVWDDDGTYANKEAKIQNKKSYEWQHTVSDVVNSLIKAGLVIQEIGEYPDLWWQYLPEAEKQEDGSYLIPGNRLPQMWSVKAGKP